MADGIWEAPPTAGLPLSWRDFIPSGLSLEPNLASLLRQEDVQIECSGTAALIVALSTLKRMSRRRSVVIPAYTCPLVALAAAHCGLRPVLCDTRRNHFDLCQKSLAEVCGDDTLAVIPTHLGGRVADLAATMAVARSCGAYVVEDAAQSVGAMWQGQPVGGVGDMGFYSLGVGKGLTIYSGGAVTAQDANLRQRLHATSAAIAPYRMIPEIKRSLELVGYFALYRPSGLKLTYGIPLRRKLRRGNLIDAVGDNYVQPIPLHRVGTWRKGIGASALKRLPTFLDTTAAQAMRRKSLLDEIPRIVVMSDATGNTGTWPFFQVLMPTQQARDDALASLWHRGLGVGRLFIHALPDYSYLSSMFSPVATPNARDFAARMLTITNSSWLKDDDFQTICSALRGLCG